jgi:hypothetical protein
MLSRCVSEINRWEWDVHHARTLISRIRDWMEGDKSDGRAQFVEQHEKLSHQVEFLRRRSGLCSRAIQSTGMEVPASIEITLNEVERETENALAELLALHLVLSITPEELLLRLHELHPST